MKGKRIELIDELARLLLEYGTAIRGMTPEDLLACTQWYEMDALQAGFYSIFYQGHVWGGCYSKDIIEIHPDHAAQLKANPLNYADECWHELVHNAQRHDMGNSLFNASYATQFLFKGGWIGKRWKTVISWEKEAFAAQEAFKMRMEQ